MQRDGGRVVGLLVPLWIVALTCLVTALRVGRVVLVPLAVGALLAVLLSPAVRRMQRWGLPRSLAAALVVGLLVGLGGVTALSLAVPAGTWMDRAPGQLRSLERRLRELKAPVEKVSRTTREVGRLADLDGEPEPTVSGPVPAGPSLLSRTSRLLAGALAALVSCYLLLATGKALLRRALRWIPSFGTRRKLVLSTQRIRADLVRTLVTICSVNLALSLVIAGISHVLGMPNPMLWGALFGLANFAPYVGPTVATVIMGLAGLAQFDSTGRALLPALTCLAVSGLEGQVLTPHLLGQRLQLNPWVVFSSILGFFVLWGVPGALMAVPILVVVKLGCEAIPSLAPLADVLGASRERREGPPGRRRSERDGARPVRARRNRRSPGQVPERPSAPPRAR